MTFAVRYSCPSLALSNGTTSAAGQGSIELSDEGDLRALLDMNGKDTIFLAAQGRLVLSGQTTEGFSLKAAPAIVIDNEAKMLAGRPPFSTSILALGQCEVTAQPPPSMWTSKLFHVANATVNGVEEFDEGLYRWRLEPAPYGLTLRATRLGQGCHDPRVDRTMVDRLLSFFMRGPCPVVREDAYDQASLVAQGLLPRSQIFAPSNPLRPADAASLADFLKQTMAPYRQSHAAFNLPLLLSYYRRIHIESTAEIKLILGGVLMEALKFNWALNGSSLLVDRKTSGLVRGFYERVNGKGDPILLKFEDLLARAATNVGYTSLDTTFIEERNSLFHSGQSSFDQLGGTDTYEQLRPKLERLADDIDGILLSILGYKGPVTSWWTGEERAFP